MIKHKFAALLTAGAFLSLGTGAIAQQNPTAGTQTQRAPMQNGQTPMHNGQMPMQNGQAPMHNGQMMDRSATGAIAPAEKRFLTKSAQDSMYELASAQLAVKKAQNSGIKQYANKLIQDHATYNQQLMELARQKQVNLPTSLDAQNKTKLARLQQLKGEAFEREYIKETAQANNDDVKDLQRQASTTKDPQIKAFIAQFLPVQQEHSRLASGLKSGRSTASTGSTQMR